MSQNINAAKLNISMTSNKQLINLNNYTEIKINISSKEAIGVIRYESYYDQNILKLEGSYPSDIFIANNDKTKSLSLTFKLKGQKTGNSKFTFKIIEALTFNSEYYENSPEKAININVTNQKESLDSNNYLKNLTVNDYNLNFNKDTLEYNLSDDNNITSLNILATPESSKAKINILGNDNLKEGLNIIKINVEAENGTLRTYIINFNILNKKPIIIKYHHKNYHISFKDYKNYKYFIKKDLKLNDNIIPSLYHEKLKIYLINIDYNNKIKTISYKNNKTYDFKYLEYNNEALIITNKKYKKQVQFNINNQKINGYKKNNYYYFYATNLEDAKEYLYRYDNKTIQREFKNNKLKEYLLIILFNLIFIVILILLILKFYY